MKMELEPVKTLIFGFNDLPTDSHEACAGMENGEHDDECRASAQLKEQVCRFLHHVEGLQGRPGWFEAQAEKLIEEGERVVELKKLRRSMAGQALNPLSSEILVLTYD